MDQNPSSENCGITTRLFWRINLLRIFNTRRENFWPLVITKRSYLKSLIKMATVDKSIVLTDSVIDGLLDDWFERDGDTFTRIKKDGRIGWESTLSDGDSYSAYFMEAPSQEELIKRAYSLAKDTITAMDPPFKVCIKITTNRGGSSGTDGRLVCVNTAMFDDEELSVGEKLDTFLGVTVHEGCHLLYTDLTFLKEMSKPVIKHIWNISEDERVEQLCGEYKPGLANFLEKSKYYYFDQYYLDYVVPLEKEHSLTPFRRILNCFLHIIRYPKYLKEEEIIEFGHYLLEVKKVLCPYPTSTKEAADAAQKVFEIIKDFYEEIEKESSDSEGEESESDIKKRAYEKLTKDSEEASSALEKIAGAPKSMPTEFGGKGGLDPSDISTDVLKDDELLGEVCEGVVELGESKDSFFSKMPDCREEYMKAASKIKRYVPAISKILRGHCKEYKLVHRSMRSGVLDTNKLAEAYQGVSTVYLREGEVKTDKVSVCVLIDESGSMNGERIRAARETAILINEAIGNIPNVELYIYGHSGDIKRSYSTELYVYRERGYSPKFSLGSCEARSENRDGVAILEVAKRVRKQTKNHVLFFILSDGSPCAGGYYGDSAIRHVKSVVSGVERLDFSVIQVCINHVYNPGDMFRHFVILEDMSTLSSELGKIIKKATMRAARTHVS